VTFEDWMRHRGLSPASVEKYQAAIHGVMSRWAMENGLLEGRLTAITTRAHFELIAEKLRALPIFQDRNEKGKNMYGSALNQFREYLAEGYDDDIESDIDSIVTNPELAVTEKSSLIKARIGQGKFREKLVDYWGKCAVTGFKDTNLLVASHIKPWKASNNAERVNKFNGLLLIPNLDRSFDSGLITFEADGRIRMSPQLTEAKILGITLKLGVKLKPQHEPFMAFHRTVVYRSK
jgi:predicted restriction endonuclease